MHLKGPGDQWDVKTVGYVPAGAGIDFHVFSDRLLVVHGWPLSSGYLRGLSWDQNGYMSGKASQAQPEMPTWNGPAGEQHRDFWACRGFIVSQATPCARRSTVFRLWNVARVIFVRCVRQLELTVEWSKYRGPPWSSKLCFQNWANTPAIETPSTGTINHNITKVFPWLETMSKFRIKSNVLCESNCPTVLSSQTSHWYSIGKPESCFVHAAIMLRANRLQVCASYQHQEKLQLLTSAREC